MTGKFEEADGAEIFYRYAVSKDDKAGVVICHGLGEHSGRYTNLTDLLRPAHIAYFAMDHRGHGRSSGRKGRILRFEQLLSGVRQTVDFARAQLGEGKKLILFGHSMGGLIAANYALRFPESIDGLILSGAALKLAAPVPAVKGAAGKLLSSIMPGLAMGNELDVNGLSRDRAVVEAYLADPLVHDRISTRLFTELLNGMDSAHTRAKALTLPTLIFHGGADILTHPEGSKEFFDAISSEDKTLKIYDGYFHETLNELGKEAVLDDVMAWINAHI